MTVLKRLTAEEDIFMPGTVTMSIVQGKKLDSRYLRLLLTWLHRSNSTLDPSISTNHTLTAQALHYKSLAKIRGDVSEMDDNSTPGSILEAAF